MRGLLTALFRQQTKIFIIFGLITFIGIFYLANMTHVYEAKGSLLVKFGQGAVLDLDRSGRQGGTEFSPNDRDEIIQSNIKILQSTVLLSEVLDKIGVDNFYPGLTEASASVNDARQTAIERLNKKDLKVFSDSKSNIIDVRVTNKDPEIAKKFTETLMEQFIIRQAEVYRTPQTNFLQQQIAEAKQQLQESQKKFQEFKKDVGISALDEEMEQLLQEKRDLSGLAFKAVTDAQANLAKLEAEEAEARSTYISSSPTLKRIRESIAVARKEMQDRQDDLNVLGAEGSSLSQKVANIDGRIAYLEAQRNAYEDYKQRVTMDEENYKYYQQRGEEARVNDMLNQQNITRISIVDKPVVPAKPLPLKRALLGLALLMTAGLISLGVAIVFELLDESITYPEQITASTGLPVLATFEQRTKGTRPL
jgi:tyrosine-protein kinase Etk/Wzc